MELKLVYTTSDQLDELPIVNGQICVLTDRTAFYYDMNGFRNELINKTPAELGFGYAICTTPASTSAKSVSISDYSLEIGSLIAVRFSNAVNSGATLNVSETGAKPIYYRGFAIDEDVLIEGSTALLMYDGSSYNVVNIDGGADYSALTVAELTEGTSSDSRVVRADYLKEGIESVAGDLINDGLLVIKQNGVIKGTFSANQSRGSEALLTDTVPNDGTLTIQKNGVDVQTFSADQSTNSVANITVPTAVSELTNDSNFVSDNPEFTESSSRTNIASGESFSTILGKVKKFFTDLKTVAFTGSYNDLSDQPTIPAAQVNSDWNSYSGVSQILNKPTLGTAASKDVPATGNASISEVVLGSDSRLTDSRNAKDVYEWAKASSKPSYTASEVGAIATTAKGANGGVAELDSTGKVPTSQLPSFVDDVLEFDTISDFPDVGETGKIYIAKDINKTYRWSGSAYTEISASLALGETSSTAYRGDRGKVAYDHSQSSHARTDATAVAASTTNGNIKINGTETTVYTHPGSGTNPHGTTKSDVGLGNVGNFKAVSTVASQGLTDTEKANARANIGAGTSSLTLGTTSTTAAAGDHSHAINIATDSGTNQITLAANTKYKLVAGGQSFVFTTPPDNNTNTHRPIQMNGTEILGNNTTALNIAAGTNVSLANDGGKITIAATDTKYSAGSNITLTGTAFSLTKANVTGALGYTPPTADTDTHRPIQMNGTEILGNNATALNLKAGSNVTLTHSSGTVTIAASQPTVNNATLTIQKNGTNVQTFTANQSTNATANITVPTKVSELTNDSGYTTNVGTITGIKMNGSSKGTSGVVDLGTVITSHQDISGKVNKSGDTMTGQLKTSFKSAVAMGSYCATATTIPNLCEELRYSSGCCGSVSIGTAYTKDSITVATGWYNFLWIPHRSGGSSGSASGDNCNYGSLYLSGMTVANSCYLIRYHNEAIAEIHNLYKDTTYGVVSTSSNGLAPKVTDTTKFLKGDGTWATPANTTYSAGTGISLSGTTFSNAGIRDISINGNYLRKNLGGTETDLTIPYATLSTTSRKVVNDSTRPATADTQYSDGGLHYYLASSYMTTNKPPADGAIIHLAWDNDGGYDKQLYIGHEGSTNTHAYVRSQNAKTWGSWIPVAIFNQTSPTSGQVVVTDGTSGSVKSSGYTIATSVPSNAVFTDTKNTAGSTDTSSKIFLIGATSQAANPQTYSDDQVYATNGTLTAANVTAAIHGVTSLDGTSGGISLYNGTGYVAEYGVAFRKTSSWGTHGSVTSDWATYFTMSNTNNRGWIFRRYNTGNVASIDTNGNEVINGTISIGGTSGCKLSYNSTNKCVDFIFA